MNPYPRISVWPGAPRQAKTVLSENSPWKLSDSTKRPRYLLLVAMLILTSPLSRAQTTNAVSREVSVFNFGQVTANIEPVSREVSVFNYGYNQLNVAVGSTVVLSGTSGGVLVTFTTEFPVTNVQVAVDYPQGLLTSWSVQPEPSLTGTAAVSNNNQVYVIFSPTNGQYISNTQNLGQITFFAISNQPSAFLPLVVDGVTAPLPGGAVYTPDATAEDGQVVVLNKRSLMRQWFGTNGQQYVTLYGLSGTNYTLEATTNLGVAADWHPFFAGLIPTNFIIVTPGAGLTNPAMFFRAQQ
jgi:hypothetical protein